MNWPNVPLGSVANIVRIGIDPKGVAAGTRYVGLEHILSDGRVSDTAAVDTSELASTKFSFASDHVLFGKLRPYLRKVARPPFGGICSTDILPIAPSQKKLDRGYLFHFLRTDEVIRRATSMASGANLPRVSPRHLLEFEIPLPPLDEQRRIAAILDQADSLRRNSTSLARWLKEIEKAYFTECFDDLSVYPKAQFGDLIESQRIGLVRGAGEFGHEMSHPYLRMDAISREGDILDSLIQTTEASASELAIYSLKSGDFIFNTRNSRELVGKSAVWRGKEGCIFNNNLMRVRFGPRILADFVQFALGTPYLKHELEIRKTGTTSVFAVYWRDLKTLPVPVPPMNLQQFYAKRLAKVGNLRASIFERHAILDSLFNSLQHRAFCGEL